MTRPERRAAGWFTCTYTYGGFRHSATGSGRNRADCLPQVVDKLTTACVRWLRIYYVTTMSPRVSRDLLREAFAFHRKGGSVKTPTCVSCRFFRPLPFSRHGFCSHPDRQYPGVPIIVRAGELNCYRGFGRDDWSPSLIGFAPTAQDIVLSERPAPFRASWPTFPLIPNQDDPPAYHD
jgi:hypothetical protein